MPVTVRDEDTAVGFAHEVFGRLLRPAQYDLKKAHQGGHQHPHPTLGLIRIAPIPIPLRKAGSSL